MDPLAPLTQQLFRKNRLAGLYNYVRPGEVVPHFFSRGSYYLTRDESQRQLKGVVNSCLHRGFKLVPERRRLSEGQAINCRFHNWTYARQGELLATPGFDREVKNCLRHVELSDLGGIFFETASIDSVDSIRELFEAEHVKDLWLDSYTFDQENVTFYQCNWRTFMEVYLDAYHHEHAHPKGLGKFLTNDVSWQSGKEWAVNVVGIAPASTVIPSFGWSKFNEQVRKVGWDKPWGALFCTIFPGLMLEFFPHTLVVSQLVPISNKMTANYLQIYYDETVAQDFDFQNAFSDAYSETAAEDGALQDLLEDGRMANWYYPASLPRHGLLEAGIDYLQSWEARNSG